MDKHEMQRRIFTIVAVFMLDGIPKAAAIATSIAMGIRLLILLGILYGIRMTKRKRRINNEINLAVAIALLLLGLVLMDGAFAYVDSLRFVSIGMFVSVFCDFAVVIVSVTALFLLKKA
jgi:hypothetical protein